MSPCLSARAPNRREPQPMTTPPTPAGWYPDPEHGGQLRYWDGMAWTEHRSPVQQPPTPQAPYPTPPPTVEHTGEHTGGAHRAPDPEPESEPSATDEPSTLDDPTTKVPLREWSFEPPPLDPEENAAPAPLPLTEQPTTKVPLRDWTAEPATEPPREPAPYADATTSTPPVPPEVEPPAGTEPPAPVDNRKLVLGFAGAVAALLVLLVLAAVYAFVIHKPDTVSVSAPSSQTSTTTTEETTTSQEASASEAPLPPPAAGATDGPLTFTVDGVETGTTITDSENEFLSKDAVGEFIVVRLTVQNDSQDPGQFLGTFQKLNAGGQVFSIDDEATFYVGGGFVDIPPGAVVNVGLAYDVPPGTAPESVELHADPTGAGVVLPLG
ncbi:DUF4352 domain-containing protein [Mycolicibacterium moriokaense]|nr:DUF4352 domain-containing protein [Mycolicibacterium moriokaense]